MAGEKDHIIGLGRERRGHGRGTGLTIVEKEAIYQAYLAMGNQAAVARTLGCSRKTVHAVIKGIESSLPATKLKEAREQMAVNLTGRYHETTQQILDSIKPEDLESGRIPVYNAKGELTGYTYFGPTLVAKATAAGIMTDKIRVLADYEKAIGKDAQSGQLIMPETAADLIKAIQAGVKEISVLNVRFRDDEPALAKSLETIAPADAEVLSGVPGELDLRNPS